MASCKYASSCNDRNKVRNELFHTIARNANNNDSLHLDSQVLPSSQYYWPNVSDHQYHPDSDRDDGYFRPSSRHWTERFDPGDRWERVPIGILLENRRNFVHSQRNRIVENRVWVTVARRNVRRSSIRDSPSSSTSNQRRSIVNWKNVPRVRPPRPIVSPRLHSRPR